MAKNSRISVWLALVTLGIVAACGGDEGNSGGSAPPTQQWPSVFSGSTVKLLDESEEPVATAIVWLSETTFDETETPQEEPWDIPFTECNEAALTQEDIEDVTESTSSYGCSNAEGIAGVGFANGSCGVDGKINIKIRRDELTAVITGVNCNALVDSGTDDPLEFTVTLE